MGDGEEHLYVTVEYFLSVKVIHCVDDLIKAKTPTTLLPLMVTTVGHPTVPAMEDRMVKQYHTYSRHAYHYLQCGLPV